LAAFEKKEFVEQRSVFFSLCVRAGIRQTSYDNLTIILKTAGGQCDQIIE